MKFEFNVQNELNTINIKATINANKTLLWRYHTESNLLNKWFAPPPFTVETKSMNFKIGGHWHYAMIAPDGTKYWGLTEYTSISPMEHYSSLDGFSNENGDINNDLPRAKWQVNFSELDQNSSMVEINIVYDSIADLETIISMGMEEGITMTYNNLNNIITN